MILSDRAVALAHEIEAGFPFESVRRHPVFPAMARRLVDVWSGADSAEGDDARPLRDITRFSAALLICHLEATPGGLTLARLKGVIERPGLGGIGHSRAVLTYLRYIRYIEPLPRDGDGRMQRYRVTQSTRGMLRTRLRRELEARRDYAPEASAMLARLDDDASFDAYLIALSETTLAILRDSVTRTNPVDLFSGRQSGMLVLCELTKAGAEGDVFPPRGPLAYSVAELARRCDTSRMQVTHLLRRGRAAGFLVATPDGGERFSAELADGFERAVASTSLLVLGAARLVVDGFDPGVNGARSA